VGQRPALNLLQADASNRRPIVRWHARYLGNGMSVAYLGATAAEDTGV